MVILFGKKKETVPAIYTVETCTACGDKVRRVFEEGDYVFLSKGESLCKNCGSSSTMMVNAIYGEYPPEKNAAPST
jgi:hypothetical protein